MASRCPFDGGGMTVVGTTTEKQELPAAVGGDIPWGSA
jgi:hypothetical protein